MFSQLEGIHPAFLELVGFSSQGYVGQRFHFEFSQKALAIFLRLLHSRCTPQCVERLRKKHHSPIPRDCQGLFVVGQPKRYRAFVSNEASHFFEALPC